MSEFKAENIKETPKVSTGKSETVYVTIPETDIFDSQHPGVHLIGGEIKEYKDNRWIGTGKAGTNFKFEAGKTYEVPVAVGAEIEARLKAFHKESVRLLRPKTDQKSINQVNANSLWAKGAGFSLENEDALSSKLAPGEKVVTVAW